MVGDVEAFDGFGDRTVDVLDGVKNALAEIAGLIAIAQFQGFVFAGRSAGGHRCAAACAVFEQNVGFDGRIAARVENLPPDDAGNFIGRGADFFAGVGSRFRAGFCGGLRGHVASGEEIRERHFNVKKAESHR